MSWTATLKYVAENVNPTDDISVTVDFTKKDGKVITKDYLFKSAGVQSFDDVKATIQNEIDRLDSFDSIKDMLKLEVGKELGRSKKNK